MNQQSIQTVLRIHYSQYFHLILAFINFFFFCLSVSVSIIKSEQCTYEASSMNLFFLIETLLFVLAFLLISFMIIKNEKFIEGIWISEFITKFIYIIASFMLYTTTEKECIQIVISQEVFLSFYTFIVLNFIVFIIIFAFILLIKKIRT